MNCENFSKPQIKPCYFKPRLIKYVQEGMLKKGEEKRKSVNKLYKELEDELFLFLSENENFEYMDVDKMNNFVNGFQTNNQAPNSEDKGSALQQKFKQMISQNQFEINIWKNKVIALENKNSNLETRFEQMERMLQNMEATNNTLIQKIYEIQCERNYLTHQNHPHHRDQQEQQQYEYNIFENNNSMITNTSTSDGGSNFGIGAATSSNISRLEASRNSLPEELFNNFGNISIETIEPQSSQDIPENLENSAINLPNNNTNDSISRRLRKRKNPASRRAKSVNHHKKKRTSRRPNNNHQNNPDFSDSEIDNRSESNEENNRENSAPPNLSPTLRILELPCGVKMIYGFELQPTTGNFPKVVIPTADGRCYNFHYKKQGQRRCYRCSNCNKLPRSKFVFGTIEEDDEGNEYFLTKNDHKCVPAEYNPN